MRDPSDIISQLEQNRGVFQALLTHVPEPQITWKPAPDKWSLLEVVCHLYDEEREDFRARVKQTLAAPEQPWPPIDPVGWVAERHYIEQDLQDVLERFLHEREASIAWLRSLQTPNWSNTYQHPRLGPIHAKRLLHNWLAHDYFHFRQITRLKYSYLLAVGGESLDYAGAW